MTRVFAFRAAAVAACAIGAAQLLWFGRGELVDDAYVNFRYAQNWLEGHGWVFNAGEPVEGYTSFVWLAAISVAMWAGVDPEVAVAILGSAAYLATLAVLWWMTGPAEKRTGPAAFLPAFLFAANPLTALWAVHGLETTLFGLLILTAIAVELRETEEAGRRSAAR